MARPKAKKPTGDPYGGPTGGNPYENAGGGGGSVGGSIDWSSDPTTKQIDQGIENILGQNGEDPLGLASLFPAGEVGRRATARDKSIGNRIQSVTDMSEEQKNKLAEILVGAGIIKSDSKGFTTSSLQTGLDDALKQASQSGAKSLSDYLTQEIEQTASGGGLEPGATAGTESPNTQAEIALDLQNVATNYGLPMSPQAIQQWAQKYESQGLDATAAEDQFKQDYAVPTAQGLYPGFGGQLSTTVDTQTLLDPYAQIAQHTLGVDPKSINWQSPLWANALNGGVVDQKSGRGSIATLSQFSQQLMSNPAFGYQFTDEGKNAMGSLMDSILQVFGKIPKETLSTSMSGPTPDLSAT